MENSRRTIDSSSISSIVLAGGLSKRMGIDKFLLTLHQRPILLMVVEKLCSVFDEVLLSVACYSEFWDKLTLAHSWQGYLPHRITQLSSNVWKWDWDNLQHSILVIQDSICIQERCAMIGLYSGFQYTNSHSIFVVAVDMPLISQKVLAYLKEYPISEKILVPSIVGNLQPLLARYPKTILPFMETKIRKQQFGLKKLIEELPHEILYAEQTSLFNDFLQSIVNLNTPSDLIRLGNFDARG